MDAPSPEPAPPSDPEAPHAYRESATLVTYFRIDFQRCVIQRGRRPSQSASPSRMTRSHGS